MTVTARDFVRVGKRFAHVWEEVTWHALGVNVLLRFLILVFTIDALINAGDDRFAGKALGPRNVGILLGLSLLFPLLQAVRGQWKRYPMWYDNLYLSIFALDMAGNSLNLYNTVEWWDHVPHFHGPGALAVVLMGAFGMRAIAAAGLTTMLHTALETQEYVRKISQRYAMLRDGEMARSARTATPSQVAAMREEPAAPPQPTYERAVFAVRLPDGRLQLVSQ